MNRKPLLILGIAALVVSLLAVFLSLRESNRYAPTSHVRLYPDLESKLNSITRVVVQQAGQTPVTLELKDGRWRVAEKSGYPADLGQLRKTLIALAELELVEAKTRNREKYSQLDVESIDQVNAHSQDLSWPPTIIRKGSKNIRQRTPESVPNRKRHSSNNAFRIGSLSYQAMRPTRWL